LVLITQYTHSCYTSIKEQKNNNYEDTMRTMFTVRLYVVQKPSCQCTRTYYVWT